ncbi:MAG: Holliday junction resolvase RuvX [Pyrinomonadaceae bacterium]|nr:Holliday junction resolvase RuvX [Pyrinomonadaceae bacterium]
MANTPDFTDLKAVPGTGRIVGLDPGTAKVGVAITDELQKTVRRLTTLNRSNWKKFLNEIKAVIDEYDAIALIVGLPFNFDGSESAMSAEARDMARKFSLSLDIPVLLQDERTTTYKARRNLWDLGKSETQVQKLVDSEAAAIILEDFLSMSRS